MHDIYSVKDYIKVSYKGGGWALADPDTPRPLDAPHKCRPVSTDGRTMPRHNTSRIIKTGV